MADRSRIYDLASDLLAGVVSAAAGEGITLPARQYVAEGEVAWDCDLLAIAAPRIFRGRPLQDATEVARINATVVVNFQIVLLRCIPPSDEDGNPPSASALDAAGETTLTDGWLLTVGMLPTYRYIDGRCTAVAPYQALRQGPSGGLAGWSMDVEVAL